MNLCSAAHIRFTASFLLLFVATLSHSQRLPEGGNANRKIPKAKEVLLDKAGSPRFIRFEKSLKMDSLPALGMLLGLPEKSTLRLKAKIADHKGEEHFRYVQEYKGLEVLGADYIVHAKGEMAISANGSIERKIVVNTLPTLSGEAALQLALDEVGAEVYMWQNEENERFLKRESKNARASFLPESKLALSRKRYDKAEALNLVYQFDIYAQKPLGRYNVEIDAHTGEVINFYNKIHTATTTGTGLSLYNGVVPIIMDFDGANYFLSDDSTGGGIYTYDLKHGTSYGSATLFSESDNYFDQSNSRAGVSAHYGAAATYAYFLENFGRNSYDDDGAAIRSYVHYSNGYFNAFWDGSRMTYGDGNASASALVSLDIVGHEISHAVTEYSAGLVYSYESGALNESFSDIFGQSIEFATFPETASWNLGDEIYYDGVSMIRSMSNPNAEGQPDTYHGDLWYYGSGDNGGVHYNSGVQNFWYYLLVEGGTGTNDNGYSYQVNGIGLEAAQQIAYRNLTVYLTSTSDYADARIGSEQAALDLYGAGSDEYAAVVAAWNAVGVASSEPLMIVTDSVVFGQVPVGITETIEVVVANQGSGLLVVSDINVDNDVFAVSDTSFSLGELSSKTITFSFTPTETLDTSATFTLYSNIDTVSIFASGSGAEPPTLVISPDSIVDSLYTGGVSETILAIHNSGFSDLEYELSTGLVDDFLGEWLVTYDWFCDGGVSGVVMNFFEDHTFTTSEGANGLWSMDGDSIVWVFESGTRYAGLREGDFMSGLMTSGMYDGCWYADKVTDFNTPIVLAASEWSVEGEQVAAPERTVDPKEGVASAGNSNWLYTSVSEGVVAMGDTAYVAITLDAGGLYGGVYETNLTLMTNDPERQLEEIPVSLFVTGAPDVALSHDTLFFEDAFVNFSDSLNLFISNVGTDDLELDLYFEHEYFSTDSTHLSISPSAGFILPVYFQPDSVGSLSSALLFVTNDFDQDSIYVYLTGWGINPPVFGVSPDSLGAALFTGDSTTLVLTLDNLEGGSDLTWESEWIVELEATELYKAHEHMAHLVPSDGSGNNEGMATAGPIPMESMQALSGNKRILAWTTFVDMDQEYINTINAISQYYSDYQLSTTITTSAAELGNMLDTVDVFLIPEQEDGGSLSYFYDLGVSWSEVIRSFVKGGGTIILCGDHESGEILNASGLMHMAYAANAYGNALTLEDSTHYLTAGVTGHVTGQNATFVVSLSDTLASNLISYSDYAAVAHRRIGRGDVVYIGYDYYAYNDNAARVISNAVAGARGQRAWLTMETESGTIGAGESQDIPVKLNATDLYGGVYRAGITVQSNDPAKQNRTIPVHMEVTGVPVIKVINDSLQFESVYAGYEKELSVTILNQGTDILTVDMAFSDSTFITDTLHVSVGPGEAYDLPVFFQPDTAKSYVQSLWLISNDPNQDSTLVSLSGIGVNPPVMNVSPDSLHEALYTGDSATQILTIDNTVGGSDLIWKAEIHFELEETELFKANQHLIQMSPSDGSGNNQGMSKSGPISMETMSALSGQVNILSWVTYADMDQEYLHTLNAISQYFTDYRLSSTTITSATVLAGMLDTVDVFLIPEQEYASNSYFKNLGASWAEVLTAFAERGGAIILCGNPSAYNIIDGSGLMHMEYFMPVYSEVLTVEDSMHYLTEGISGAVLSQDGTFLMSLADSAVSNIVSYYDHSVVAHKNVGLGDVVYIGYDFFNYDDNAARMIANAVASANRSSWLSLGVAMDTIAGGELQEVPLTFSAKDLYGGQYRASINILSNDPASSELSIPVVMEVTGAPVLSINSDSLPFADTYVGYSDKVSILISNEGTDDLEISLSLLDSVFAIDTAYLLLAPEVSYELAVYFNPDSAGVFEGDLLLATNDLDRDSTFVSLTGTGVNPPVMTVSPDSISAALMTDETVIKTLTVDNTAGGSELVVQFESRIHAQTITKPLTQSRAPSSTHDPTSLSQDFGGYLSDTARVLIIQNSSAWGTDMRYFLQEIFGITAVTVYSQYLSGHDLEPYDLIITTGDQDYEYYETISNNRERFEDYVENGGVIQYQLATQGSNVSLVGGVNIIHGSADNRNTLDAPDHPIGKDLPLVLEGNSANHTYLTDLPEGATVITSTEYSTRPTTAEYSYGSGHVIVTGMTVEYLALSGFNSAPLLGNITSYTLSLSGQKWLKVPEADTIPAGEYRDFEVLLNAKGLYGGLYSGEIDVLSNDPASPVVSVPVGLFVTGIPDMEVDQDTVDFGKTFVGTSNSRPLQIENEGTDTLYVSDVVFDHLSFTVDTTSFYLLPKQTQTLEIIYSPEVVADDTVQMSISSNDPDEVPYIVYLLGQAVHPPIAGVDQDSLSESLLTGLQSTQTLTLENTGGSELEWSLEINDGGAVALTPVGFYGAPSPQVDVPELSSEAGGSHFGSIEGEVLDTLANFTSSSTGIYVKGDTIYTVNYNQARLDKYSLSARQVVESFPLHSSPYGITYAAGLLWIGSYDGLVRAYDSGGSFAGSFSVPFSNYPAIAFNGTHFILTQAIEYNEPFYVVDFDGTILNTYEGINAEVTELAWSNGTVWTLTFNGESNIYPLTISDGAMHINDTIRIPDDDFAYSLAHDEGKLYWNAWNSDALVLKAGKYYQGDWLFAGVNEGVLDAGESTHLALNFNAYGLAGGLYQKEIRLITNDPETPTTRVPVALEVTSAPNIDPLGVTVDFDQVFVGDSAIESMTIANVGVDELIIHSSSIDHSDFSTFSGGLTIPPGGEREFYIKYHPQSSGIVNATLTIVSNDPDEGVITVSLSGEGILPPEISVAPGSLSESLILGEQTSQNLRVENTGSGADLVISLKVSEPEGQVKVETSPVFTSADDQVSKDETSAPDLSQYWRQHTRSPLQNTVQDTDHVDLVNLKKSLNEKFQSITGLISNRYDFSDGVEGTGINDGGGDMYDGGNYLGTNLGSYIPYSNDLITTSNAFGSGEYFTLKKPGLFVLAANLEEVTTFYVSGNLGADGSGSVDGAVIEMDVAGRTFLGFVKRVYNSGDPSINHLIIVEDNGEATHQFSTNTNYDDHSVNGLSNVRSIHYLLFAGTGSRYYDNHTMTSVMSAYLETIQIGPKWLSVDHTQDTITAGGFAEFNVGFASAEMTVGRHQANIEISSNDFASPQIVVPVSLQVSGIPDIMLSSLQINFGEVEVGQTSEHLLTISNLGNDSLLVGSIASNYPDFTVETTELGLAVGEDHSLTVTYTPTTVATHSGTLQILSNDPNESKVLVSLSGTGIPISNTPPELDGFRLSVPENSPVGYLVDVLQGSDSDGDTLSYGIVSGNESLAFELSGDGRLLINDSAMFNYEQNPLFELTIEVSDGEYQDTAQVWIDVTDLNDRPTIETLVFGIPENSPYGYSVGYLVGEDEDGDSLQYEIIGDNQLVFEVFESGILTVKDSSLLNFEIKKSFDLIVVVQDYALSDTAIVTVNLTNVNDRPVAMDQTFEVFENSPAGTVVGNISATDEDGDSLIFEMDSHISSAAFEVSVSGELTVKDPSLIDFEEQEKLYFDVIVTDLFDQTTFRVTVTVLDIEENTPPSFSDQTFEIPENSPKGYEVGQLTAVDQENDSLIFTILNSEESPFELLHSQLLVADSSRLDYEVNTYFELTMTVSDGAESDTALITIYLTDVNENGVPIILDQSFSVLENSPSGHEIGEVVATDADGDALAFSIIRGNSGNPVTLTSMGVLFINDSSLFDFEVSPVFELVVTVSDGLSVDSATVTIHVVDLDETPENHEPVILDQSFSVEENTRSGIVVGTVVATDEDEDVLTYEIISGNSDHTFALDMESGVLSIDDSTALDFEVNRNISFIVQVSDLTSSDIAIVSIQITDQVETGPLGLDSDHELLIYPNPSLDGHVSIENGRPIRSLKLLDTSGKVLVFVQGEGRQEIGLELSDFDRGVYYLIIEDVKSQLIRKLILE
ncbi:Ig-like domain-containing protein [Marinoscillum luteum]|uniref:Choice-of-anchor D domain-containing protein n=1 Tax=Marinoscillum luteum TaxID=861051 RepID=A0ABW7N9Z3_9BACT